MKAVILSGGKGTRLLPLTLTTPKPMLPICGKPHLYHTIVLLKEHGIKDIVFSTGYLHKHIIDYFKDGSDFGVNIEYREDGGEPLGTAGAIKNCQDLLEDNADFLVFNGDILTNINLTSMMSNHKQNLATGGCVTMALALVEDPSQFGVAVRKGNLITDFIEKPKTLDYGRHVNAGIYIMNKGSLNNVPERTFSMIESEVFPCLASQSKLFSYCESDMKWIDIGTHERYLQANQNTF